LLAPCRSFSCLDLSGSFPDRAVHCVPSRSHIITVVRNDDYGEHVSNTHPNSNPLSNTHFNPNSNPLSNTHFNPNSNPLSNTHFNPNLLSDTYPNPHLLSDTHQRDGIDIGHHHGPA